MKESDFEDNTTLTKLPDGKYNLSCDRDIWSTTSVSKYGALEDGKKLFLECIEGGWYGEDKNNDNH